MPKICSKVTGRSADRSGVGSDAPYTVSTEHLKAIRALSDKLNAAVVIHVAETKKERDDIKKQYGEHSDGLSRQDRIPV